MAKNIVMHHPELGGLIESPPYHNGPGSVFCAESIMPFSPLLLAGNAKSALSRQPTLILPELNV